MSAEENKVIVRRLDDALETKEVALADDLVADDFIDHYPAPGQMLGRDGFIQSVMAINTAFPDIETFEKDFIAEGDKVVYRWKARFTHQNEFQGIPPTGKRVTLSGIDIYRLTGGKIVERWSQFDALGLMQQLGAIPPPGQGGG